MESIKDNPGKKKWTGENIELVTIQVSHREYGIRLDQLAQILYEEFCQLL